MSGVSRQRDHDSVVIYDVGPARPTCVVYEDRRLSARRPVARRADDVAYASHDVAAASGTGTSDTAGAASPRSDDVIIAAAAVAASQPSLYDIIESGHPAPSDAAIASTTDETYESMESQGPRGIARARSSSTTELLDEQQSPDIAAPAPSSRATSTMRRPPQPPGRPPRPASEPNYRRQAAGQVPVAPKQPSKWRPESRVVPVGAAVGVRGQRADGVPAVEDRPSTHHAWAYLACLLCLPIGIAAWLKAEESRKLLIARNFYKARSAGEEAKGLSFFAIGILLALGILFIIFYFTTVDKIGHL